jgi:signal transduction histidine kinase
MPDGRRTTEQPVETRPEDGDLSAQERRDGPRRAEDAAESGGRHAAPGERRRSSRRRADLLGREIRDELDVEVLLHKAIAAIASYVKSARVLVHLTAQGSFGAAEVEDQWHRPDLAPITQAISPDALKEIVDMLADQTESIVIDDIVEMPVESPARRDLLGVGFRSIVLTPIVSADRQVLGALTMVHVEAHAWTDDEVRLCDIAADELASALQRARLFAGQQDLVRQLQELDRSKSEFLSTVSHELRTPLTSIAGYVELLLEGEAGPISDSQARMLEIVNRNARRLRLLIEDLLMLSRIEIGTFRAGAERIDLTEVISTAVAVVEPSVKSQEIDLEVHCSSDLGQALGEGEQLDRAMLNLLSNAVKFTPKGGKVTVDARREGPDVVISVADTGIGIPPQDLDRLFTRFFRASNATKRAIPGTGLGLTIVRGIVELHGGSLQVDSTVDVGTTFTIRLPAFSED